MMWDEVMARVLPQILEHPILAPMFGTRVRMAGSGDLEIPSIEYTILSEINAEVTEPMLVQIDIWTARASDNRTAERIIRSLFNQRTSVQWDGVTLITDYMDGSFLSTPDRAGFIGRGLRFRFAPLKQQYTLSAH